MRINLESIFWFFLLVFYLANWIFSNGKMEHEWIFIMVFGYYASTFIFYYYHRNKR